MAVMYTIFVFATSCYGLPTKPAIEVVKVTSADQLWNDRGSGGRHDIRFWRPSAPPGFHILGDYAQPNYGPFSPSRNIIAVRDLSGDALRPPVSFTQVWNDRGSGARTDGSIWRPNPPRGYKAMGLMSVVGYGPPSKNEVVCVKDSYVLEAQAWTWLWDNNGQGRERCTVTQFESKDLWALNTDTFRAFNSYSYPGPTTPEMNVLNRRYLKLAN